MATHAHPANIHVDVLRWSMERAGLSDEDLADYVGTSLSIVQAWLNGTRKPTFPQAKKIASKTRVPFGFLFLPSPPSEALPIPDFRTVAGRPVGEVSLDLRDLVLDSIVKQDWLSEYRKESGASEVEFVGSARPDASAKTIASDIRSWINLDNIPIRSKNADQHLRTLIRRVESIGVLVLRSGVVGNNTSRPLSVREFRGFSLSDRFAPLIFINSLDSKSAQSFTLMHELGHIWRGDSGISGGLQQSSSGVETLCNKVAAEVLVPGSEFEEQWRLGASVEDSIELCSEYFRASKYVVAIRAYESGLIDRDTVNQLLSLFESFASIRTQSPSGNFYNSLIARNGVEFTSAVVTAVSRQQILLKDAANLLGSKIQHLPRIAREVSQRA